MKVKDTLLALIPPLAVLLLVVAISSCAPAHADTYPYPCTGECRQTPRSEAVEVPEDSGDAPTLVKAVAVAVLFTLMLSGNEGMFRIERTDSIVKLLPDHRATFVMIDIPLK